MFLRATLKDGTQVVSEFHRLSHVEKYIGQVFAGAKSFNAWKVVGNTHPVSGETVLMRERTLLNGRAIVRVEEVEPITSQHGMDPTNFRPVVKMERGRYGAYTVPEQGAPEALAGVEAGTEFPKHRDPNSFRDYILLRSAGEEQEEVRYYLDGRGDSPYGEPVTVEMGLYSGDDEDDWEDEDDD